MKEDKKVSLKVLRSVDIAQESGTYTLILPEKYNLFEALASVSEMTAVFLNTINENENKQSEEVKTKIEEVTKKRTEV